VDSGPKNVSFPQIKPPDDRRLNLLTVSECHFLGAMAHSALRVVSVLPSATEMLCFIGGESLLVGRSHEDNFPASVGHLPILTGQRTTFTTAADVDRQVSQSLSEGKSLYTIDVDLLKRLRPDVILTQDICSVCAIDLPTIERVAASMDPRPTVVSLNPNNFQDVLDNILQLGAAVHMEKEAQAAHDRLLQRVEAVDRTVEGLMRDGKRKANVAFIEWPDPLYVGGHWTPQLIARAGGQHPLNLPEENGAASKSFAIKPETLVSSEPDLIIIAPCGLDLAATKVETAKIAESEWWGTLGAVKNGRVALVDGDAMFNRPGPRLVDALEWLVSVIHNNSQLAPEGFPAEWLTTKRPSGVTCSADKEMSDIEDLHRCAMAEGKMHYIDPATGYTVFTQLASSSRGYCCGRGCRHCAHGHKNVPAERRLLIKPPINI
jgi:iron complex transport system substrate-binding protein